MNANQIISSRKNYFFALNRLSVPKSYTLHSRQQICLFEVQWSLIYKSSPFKIKQPVRLLSFIDFFSSNNRLFVDFSDRNCFSNLFLDKQIKSKLGRTGLFMCSLTHTIPKKLRNLWIGRRELSLKDGRSTSSEP